MDNLPIYVSLLFALTALITILWFYRASGSKEFLFIATLWTLIQVALGITEVYQNTDSMPPRIMILGIFPAIIMILISFFTKRGQAFIDQINLKPLTYFHSIRIPVEIVLALLFKYGLVSVYMTYEGTNFDLISGVSAAIVAYVAFRGSKRNTRLLLTWNIICLILLLNVVITAVFAFPSPFQKIAFDQPNIAILYFPFNLLPTVVVPLVLLAHLTAIRQLTRKPLREE